VADGTRTRDFRDHNPGLYQLSYGHRAGISVARLPRRNPPPAFSKRLAKQGGSEKEKKGPGLGGA
jgi:hypothetical protein